MNDLTLELFATSQNNQTPNPKKDPVMFIIILCSNQMFFIINEPNPGNFSQLSPESLPLSYGLKSHYNLLVTPSERDCLSMAVFVINFFDPDLIWGVEIEKEGIGYLSLRMKALKMNFSQLVKKENTLKELVTLTRIDLKQFKTHIDFKPFEDFLKTLSHVSPDEKERKTKLDKKV